MDNCDWRCGIDENILDIDYRFKEVEDPNNTTENIVLTTTNPGSCVTTEGCPLVSEVCPSTSARCPLSIDTNGYYQHVGTPTSPAFYRVAVIELEGDLNGDGNNHNDFSVISTVCWQERGGKWHGVCVEEHLYNWAH